MDEVDPRITRTVQEAADILGVSLRTMRTMVADGRIESVRIGGRVMIPLSAIHTGAGAASAAQQMADWKAEFTKLVLPSGAEEFIAASKVANQQFEEMKRFATIPEEIAKSFGELSQFESVAKNALNYVHEIEAQTSKLQEQMRQAVAIDKVAWKDVFLDGLDKAKALPDIQPHAFAKPAEPVKVAQRLHPDDIQAIAQAVVAAMNEAK